MARTASLFGITVLFALVAVLLLLAPSAANAAQQACPQSDVRPDAWVQVPPTHPPHPLSHFFSTPIAQTFGYARRRPW
jgi:hypothetical protein